MAKWVAVTGLGVILLSVAFQPSRVSASSADWRAVSRVLPPTSQRERHPEINGAIRALERAKAHLQKAAHDFGGHRAEALEAVDKALEQLRQALQYDKK
ncbi:MAG TPA: hypothetical protein VM736_12115 [Gemmatimonadales bacterium]|nr:hypothetical protein [Gemmatimonadales bacterium]